MMLRIGRVWPTLISFPPAGGCQDVPPAETNVTRVSPDDLFLFKLI